MAKNKVTAHAKFWNLRDEEEIRSGRKAPVELEVKVDDGSFLTVLPERMAQDLGLPREKQKTKVTFADGRSAQREIALGLRVEVLGRPTVCSAIVEPGRDTVLLGLDVLEHLDLWIDTGRKTVIPNPEFGGEWVHVVD